MFIVDWRARNTGNREVINRHAAVAVAKIDANTQVGDVMKRQRRRRDTEACAAFTAAYPLDDVIDVENQIVAPVTLARVANIEAHGVDDIVVPRQIVEFEP